MWWWRIQLDQLIDRVRAWWNAQWPYIRKSEHARQCRQLGEQAAHTIKTARENDRKDTDLLFARLIRIRPEHHTDGSRQIRLQMSFDERLFCSGDPDDRALIAREVGRFVEHNFEKLIVFRGRSEGEWRR